jgi:DNA repair protein RadC
MSRKKLTPRHYKIINQAKNILQTQVPTYFADVSGPSDVKLFVKLMFAGKEREEMWVLFLTSQFNVIEKECISFGTIDSAPVYPRELVKRALELNAANVILAHNHPSGDPKPSEADKRITQKVVSALALVDIRVLDHIIVGSPEVVSMAEQGLL